MEEGLLAPGVCARIDVVVLPSGAARVHRLRSRRLGRLSARPAQEQELAAVDCLHIVLTGPMLPEFIRLGRQGTWPARWCQRTFWRSTTSTWQASTPPSLMSTSLLSAGRATGRLPELAALSARAAAHGVLAIFTLGERGLLLLVDAAPRFVPVRRR